MTIKLTARQHADLRDALRQAYLIAYGLVDSYRPGLSATTRKLIRLAKIRAVRYAALDDYLEQAGRKPQSEGSL